MFYFRNLTISPKAIAKGNLKLRLIKSIPLRPKPLNSESSIDDVTIERMQDGKTETMILENSAVTSITEEGPK